MVEFDGLFAFVQELVQGQEPRGRIPTGGLFGPIGGPPARQGITQQGRGFGGYFVHAKAQDTQIGESQTRGRQTAQFVEAVATVQITQLPDEAGREGRLKPPERTGTDPAIRKGYANP